jgi:hypothetical protein
MIDSYQVQKCSFLGCFIAVVVSFMAVRHFHRISYIERVFFIFLIVVYGDDASQ